MWSIAVNYHLDEQKGEKSSEQQWTKMDGNTKGKKVITKYGETGSENIYFFFVPNESQLKTYIKKEGKINIGNIRLP